jgi:ligand-binding SRPBCC domain-containing protein
MLTSPQRFHLSSALRATPQLVWEHSTSPDGINEELWPIHMSWPEGARLEEDVPLDQPLFRSVVSLLGLVALDLHEFKLRGVEPGRAFHEQSRSLMERRWEHIRTITPEPGGCRLTDELEFEPRLLPPLVALIVRRVFARRHALLRRKFGELIARAE